MLLAYTFCTMDKRVEENGSSTLPSKDAHLLAGVVLEGVCCLICLLSVNASILCMLV